jgi:WD40 repeat protein
MHSSTLRLTPAALVLLAITVVGALAAPEPTGVARPAPPVSGPRPVARAPVPKPKPEWTPVYTLEHTSALSAVAFGRETIATFAVGGPEPRPRFWSAADGKELEWELSRMSLIVPARILRFTKDDEFLMMTGSAPDDSSGDTIRYRRRPGGLAADAMGGFHTIAFSADLATLVNRERSAPFRPGRKDRLYLHGNPWEDDKNFLNHQSVLDYPGEKAVTHADLSADGRVLAVAGADGAIRVYDRATLKEQHKIGLKTGVVLTAVRLSEDGKRLVAVGERGFAKVFDGAGAELCELRGHDGSVVAVALGPDGKRVATACGKVVRVFETGTGKALGEITGHTDDVRAVAFAPDGGRLVTGSTDKTARVWKLKE